MIISEAEIEKLRVEIAQNNASIRQVGKII